MRKWLAFLVLAAVVAAGGWYYWSGGLAPAVNAYEVRRGKAAEIVYATGVVEPLRWAKVVALSRKRIEWICDCEGKPVAQGDVLVRLDDAEERAVLRELEARRKRLALDVDRIRGLVARAAATQTSLDQAITQLQEYDARMSAQQDRIADLQLRAPMDGIVLRRDGEIGEVAGTGVSDVLVWVGPPKPLRIVADVSEDDIPRVRTGQTVLLRSEGFSNSGIGAMVGDITPKGDPATKTFRVYLTLPEDTPLRIGMSVEANIVTREKDDVLIVPAEAIFEGNVYVIGDKGLERRKLGTGLRGARMVEAVAGVSAGERLATPASATLRPGQRVRVTGESAAP